MSMVIVSVEGRAINIFLSKFFTALFAILKFDMHDSCISDGHNGSRDDVPLQPGVGTPSILLLLLMTFIGRKLRHAANAPSQPLHHNSYPRTGTFSVVS